MSHNPATQEDHDGRKAQTGEVLKLKRAECPVNTGGILAEVGDNVFHESHSLSLNAFLTYMQQTLSNTASRETYTESFQGHTYPATLPFLFLFAHQAFREGIHPMASDLYPFILSDFHSGVN